MEAVARMQTPHPAKLSPRRARLALVAADRVALIEAQRALDARERAQARLDAQAANLLAAVVAAGSLLGAGLLLRWGLPIARHLGWLS